MLMRHATLVVLSAGVFLLGFTARGFIPGEPVAHAQAGGRVFELRTYTSPEGKLG